MARSKKPKQATSMAHGTAGLQRDAMAIYNARCDGVPVYIILGNYSDAAIRRGADWYHAAQDVAGMVRDYTTWDDTPWPPAPPLSSLPLLQP